MTLIVEIFRSEPSISFYISDCLLSRGGAYEENSAQFMPTQWKIEGTSTRGFTLGSKAKILGSRAILWANRRIYAQSLIKTFSEVPPFDIDSFRSQLDDVYSGEFDRESFLYGWMDEKQIVQSSYCCEQLTYSGWNYAFAGSGSDALKDVLEGILDNPSYSATDDKNLLLQLRSRSMLVLSQLIRKEHERVEFPYEAFGGAYEIIAPDFARGGFMRVPYSIVDVDADVEWNDKDGIFDMWNMFPRRLIRCVPYDTGSFFICTFFKKNSDVGDVANATVVMHCPEIDEQPMSDDQKRVLLEKALANDAASSMFTIGLMRHPEASSHVVGGEFGKVHMADGRLEISFKASEFFSALGDVADHHTEVMKSRRKEDGQRY